MNRTLDYQSPTQPTSNEQLSGLARYGWQGALLRFAVALGIVVVCGLLVVGSLILAWLANG